MDFAIKAENDWWYGRLVSSGNAALNISSLFIASSAKSTLCRREVSW